MLTRTHLGRPWIALLPAVLLWAGAPGAVQAEAAGGMLPRLELGATGGIGYVADEACAGCHADTYEDWRASHHRLAMAPATAATVRGDFSGALFEQDGKRTEFATRDGRYYVTTEVPDGQAATFEVLYTFGYDPLQQYLVALDGGRLQALDIAWDVEGARWFKLLPEVAAVPGDRLHWTGPFYNWNSNCADCHSTDLRKGFDAAAGTFDSRWSAVNVGCQACHGAGAAHVAWAEDAATGGDDHDDGGAKGLIGFTSAIGPKAELALCAQCHSRRQRISEAGTGQGDLLDSLVPALLRDEPLPCRRADPGRGLRLRLLSAKPHAQPPGSSAATVTTPTVAP